MLERLLHMSIPEIATRSRQEVGKLLERIAPPGRSLDLREIMKPAVSASTPDWAAGLADRFFVCAREDQIPRLLQEQFSDVRDRIITEAESLLRGRFDLLGYRHVSFGDPVNWNLDAVSGREAPPLHWSRIKFLSFESVGDSKVTWELNRHQWLVRLAQAYRLTADERYAQAFANRIREWLEANPPGIGINWASSLEVALRLISWCWALALFGKSIPGALLGDLLRAIWLHATHVEKYLSHYFSPNTHLTGEALGLFYAGTLFPELRASDRWRDLAMQILRQENDRQVFSDGVYFEQSTCYQRYTVEIDLHWLILAARNGLNVSSAVAERVQNMLDFLVAVRSPDGSMPEIGDADGGWLLPLASRAPDDFRGVFSVAAAVFGRGDYAWAAGGTAPEVLWLLGSQGLERLDALAVHPPRAAPSRVFPSGGYAVMRNGWETDAHQLVFDVGPLGCEPSAGHGHADLLSIQCAVFGEPYLVDPGTYSYTGDREWRDYFRGTHAHCTASVDGLEQSEPAGPFRWQDCPRARLVRWRSTSDLDYAQAEHHAYRRLEDPVVHRRGVFFVKPRFWIVVDDFTGREAHRLEIRYQFGALELELDPSRWARAKARSGHGLLVHAFAAVPLRCEAHEGEVRPARGWIAPRYGERRPAPMLTVSAEHCLPVRIATLLLPVRDSSVPFPSVSTITDPDRGLLGFVLEDSRESVLFEDLIRTLSSQD